MMRLTVTLMLIAAAGCLAQPTDDAAESKAGNDADVIEVRPAATPAVIDWLDKLEARGKSIQSFTADLVYDKQNTLLEERQVRMGSVAYAAPNPEADQSARFLIDFDRMVVGEALRQRRVEYIFDGAWLVEKNHERKMFQKRQVVAPGQSFDPLDIDGPFPLPIGQKRDAVLSRFNVTLIENNAEEDEGLIHLRLEPREDLPDAEGHKDFDRIDVYFDPEVLLPSKIVARAAPEKTTVKLTDLKIDALTGETLEQTFDTTVPKPGAGWNVDVKPFKR